MALNPKLRTMIANSQLKYEAGNAPRAPDLEELYRYFCRPTIEQHYALHGTVMDAMLPNGKRLGECTLGELKAMNARIQEIAEILGDRTVGEYLKDSRPKVEAV